MAYIILISVILALTFGNISKAAYSRKKAASPFLFTALAALFSEIFFLCYNKFQFRPDRHTLIMSTVFAACYLTCNVTALLAMGRGSISISSMISSFSLLLPTLFGIVYWNEAAKPAFWVGIVLFCVSIVLVNINTTKSGEKVKPDFLWIIFVTIMFLGNGGCSIFQTYHQKTGGENFKAEFMIIALAFVFTVNAVISLLTLKKETLSRTKAALPLSLAYGVLNAGVNLGVMFLSSGGEINQSIFFPVISIGDIVLVMLASRVFFKEKLRPLQYAGIAVGIASIVLLQI